jgi:hypothetical protein
MSRAFPRVKVDGGLCESVVMKRCPTCHQSFTYELLRFCRFDGSPLVSASREEATTLLLPPVQLSTGNLPRETRTEPSLAKGQTPRAAK